MLALLSLASGARPCFGWYRLGRRHWSRGDAALANLRLVLAGLPRLEGPHALHKLQAADWLLANGLAPRTLMREFGLDASALDAVPSDDLRKYDPAQPRVPAGIGIERGRWSGTDTFGIARPDGPYPRVAAAIRRGAGVAERAVRSGRNHHDFVDCSQSA